MKTQCGVYRKSQTGNHAANRRFDSDYLSVVVVLLTLRSFNRSQVMRRFPSKKCNALLMASQSGRDVET